VLRIVEDAAQILTNSDGRVKVLELLLEHGAVAIHNFLLHTQFEVEPMVGIEPTTFALRKRCSTTELHWQLIVKRRLERHFIAYYKLLYPDFISSKLFLLRRAGPTQLLTQPLVNKLNQTAENACPNLIR
jgi:hypothetical protein